MRVGPTRQRKTRRTRGNVSPEVDADEADAAELESNRRSSPPPAAPVVPASMLRTSSVLAGGPPVPEPQGPIDPFDSPLPDIFNASIMEQKISARKKKRKQSKARKDDSGAGEGQFDFLTVPQQPKSQIAGTGKGLKGKYS